MNSAHDRGRLLLRTAAVVLCALIAISIARPQDNSTYNFLQLDVGARAAALGGGSVVVVDDPNAIFYNPAGLATLSQRRFSFGFFKHLLDINAGHASFGTEIPNLGFVGAGVEYINYGEFQRTGEEGEDLGTFGAGELAFTGSYAGLLQPGLNYGVNAKFIYSSVAEAHSSAAALDFGLQYVAIPDRITLGISLLNLGTQFSPYVNTRESLPLDLRIGAALYPEHLPAALLISFDRLNEDQDSFSRRFRSFSVGLDLVPGPNVHFRVGYNNAARQDLKVLSGSGLAGLSIGGGINTEMYSVDYAYSSLGQIGAVHRISITF
jgi:hypothetical protein